MKKVLLLIVSLLLLFVPIAFAYETVLIDFPDNEKWYSAYYATRGSEAILQYTPVGQDANKWNKTLIFHSYKDLGATKTASAAIFMDRTTMQLEARNTSQMYDYLKYTEMDSLATRCVVGNEYIPTQCEFFRVSKSFEGLISMHYINKNTQDFKNNYNLWYNIIKNIRIYRSYYREDRIMAFWLGIMKIAEKSGLVELIAKIIKPVTKRLFNDIPAEDPAIGNIAMNFSANALGLTNAATPMGIKAMQDLQEHNINKKSASNAMCMFLAMNTASFQLVPATVIAVLAASGYKNPTEIIAPTLVVTSFTFICAIVLAKIFQRFSLPQTVDSKGGDQ